MIFSILLVLFSLLIVTFVIIHFQIFDFSNKFLNAIANLLFIIGGYAIIMTSVKSIYIIPFIGLIITGIVLNKIKINFSLVHWRSTLTIYSLMVVFFLLFFIRNNELMVPHADYLFWIRVGLSNERYGFENINVFYNLIDPSYNNPGLYHYFETWIMNFGSFINQQNASLNLFFFAYPLGLIIACFGVKQIITLLFPTKIIKDVFSDLSALFIAIGYFFYSSPWDTFNTYGGIKNMPISGMSGFGLGPTKMIFVLLIIITLFLYLIKRSKESFIILFFSAFLYPPIAPIIFVTALIWWFYLKIFGVQESWMTLFILVGLSIGFALFYMSFKNDSGNTISNFSLNEWLTVKGWIKYLPGIIMKVFFIPIISFLPIYYLIYKNRDKDQIKDSFMLIFLFYIVSVGVVAIFIKNIDAYQAFTLVFGGILTLSLLSTIWYLTFIKKTLWGVLFILIFLTPGIYDTINYKTDVKKDLISTIEYIKNNKGNRVLYLPNNFELNSVFHFNEKVYTGINQFILYNSNIDLMSIAAAMPTKDNKINNSAMYDFYLNNSPYYKKCGYFDISSTCIVNFLDNNKIDVICTPKTEINISGWKKAFENSDYNFYERTKI